MKTRAERRGSETRYFFRFAGTASLLVAGTLVLVLYVLPQRYVLSSGFREGNLSFPNPSTPFEPSSGVRVAALPPLPSGSEAVRGPAELFWERVLPLLRAERFAEALPLFEAYLADHPGDLGARREHSITLASAGRPEQATDVLRALLEHEDDAALHLLLARVLRDQRRLEEASVHYAAALERTGHDPTIVLEWARAHASVEQHAAAERVLRAGLERDPRSVPLRVELTRIHYYTGRLDEAERMVRGLTAAEIVGADAVTLFVDVLWAASPPAEPSLAHHEPVAPPTLLELAIGAREDDDFVRADSLFRAALDVRSEDPDIWQAYADFLQYEMEDFAGALEALEAVERLMLGADPSLQHRMALLEIWTGRLAAARARLEALLELLDARAARAAPVADTTAAAPAVVTKADVLALLGDLDRWSGARLAAVGRYEAALEEEPEHASAREGLDLLRAEVDRLILETERPRLGAIASTLTDTDDFMRVDLGGEWAGVREDWVWSTRAGNRWLEGVDLAGSLSDGQGLFAELEGGRWWRWGTVRTAAHLGVQTVHTDRTDLSLGASARLLGTSGRRTEIRVDHEPAYGVTNTLQAVLADVRQDEVTVSHAQPLGDRWSAAATAQAATLDHRGLPDADRNLRLSGGASVGRGVGSGLVLGLAARALRYTDQAPAETGAALYWDPELSLSVSPYAQYRLSLGTWWEMSARLNPGVGWIDERGGPTGGQIVPDLSGAVELVREGARYRSALELSYGQGRFSGYRSFGASLSFSARGGSGGGT